MGCDIHIYTEVKLNKKWGCIDKKIINLGLAEGDYVIRAPFYVPKQVYEGRCYILFGVLVAGVRYNADNVVSYSKGLPDDISDVVQEIADFELDHNPSWLTLKELIDFKWYKQIKSFEKTFCEHFFSRRKKRSTINKLIKLQKKYKVKPEEIRIVFWFDS